MQSLQDVCCLDAIATKSMLPPFRCPPSRHYARRKPLCQGAPPMPTTLALRSLARPLFSEITASPSPEKSIKSYGSKRYPIPEKSFEGDTILDERGFICNPRASRDLAFSILYAALLSGQKATRIFRERLKQAPEISGDFSKGLLAKFRYASEDEDSIFVKDAKGAKRLDRNQRQESLLEAAVLSAPITLVYNKSVLRLAQEIIQATEDSWKEHELILTDLLPERWKEPGGSAAVQQCILHMAMSEMTKLSTPPNIAINEAVELGKRYSYGRAYRVINGCLANFIQSEYFLDITQ